MKESQFKTLQKWFETLSERLGNVESDISGIRSEMGQMARRSDLEKIHQSIDAVHGMIHQAHRRIDKHLSDDDSDKRLFRLALERLDDRLMSVEKRL